MTSELNASKQGGPGWWGNRRLKYVFSTYGLIIFTALLILAFGLDEPSTFFTSYTFRSVLSTEAITVLFALAETVVVAAQQFDLSVGYLAGFSSIVIVALQVQDHLPWPLALVIGVVVGLLAGWLNGLAVTMLKIDSFIATLATGTIIYGLSQLITGGVEVAGNFSSSFQEIGDAVGGVPIPAIIAVAVSIVFWVVMEYTVFGRQLYVVGASVRGAELVGLKPPQIIRRAFLVAGLLVGIGAVLVAAEFQVGEPDIGPNYLLPAFAGAFLGATSVRPGRVNVWGTVVASVLLGVADTGLLELGAAFYVSSLFSGGLLLVAVGASVVTGNRRQRVSAPEPPGTGTLEGTGTATPEAADGPVTRPSTGRPAAVEEETALGAAIRRRVGRSSEARDG